MQDTTQSNNTPETRVLIVEDDTMIIDMVSRKLKDEHFNVKPVIDGAKAISEATLFSPQIIILDLMLPNVSGEEILKELTMQSIFNDTKVIVFTNKNREENESIVRALGAVDYLVKASTDLDTLVNHIKKLAI